MQETIAKLTPRRRIGRRLGAAATALAAVLMLAGCHEACGSGYIGAPAEGSPDIYNGRANFSFTYNCDPNRVNGRVYTYHDTSTKVLLFPTPYPGLKLKGTVTHTFVENPETLLLEPATSCQQVIEARVAQFQGNYRSLEQKYCNDPGGQFTILVYDQDNPSLPAGDFTGDGFSIELSDGPYDGYTRAGYIEGGNIYAN